MSLYICQQQIAIPQHKKGSIHVSRVKLEKFIKNLHV